MKNKVIFSPVVEKNIGGSDNIFKKEKKKEKKQPEKEYDVLLATLIFMVFYLVARRDLQLIKTSDIVLSKLQPLTGNSTSFFEPPPSEHVCIPVKDFYWPNVTESKT